MHLKELSAKVAKEIGVPNIFAQKVVKSVFNNIQATVAKGEKVQILGFGSFKLKTRAARKGRNPSTGESIDLPERTLPHFTPGTEFKAAIKKS